MLTLNNSPTAESTRESRSCKRMSISLSVEASELLDFLAQSQGITQNEALRRAISTEAFFLKEMKSGAKVLIQNSDKEIREILFR
jgi:predicted DNA-binding protein